MYLQRAFFLTLGLMFLVGFSMTVVDMNKSSTASVANSLNSQSQNVPVLQNTQNIVQTLSNAVSIEVINKEGLNLLSLPAVGYVQNINMGDKAFSRGISIKAVANHDNEVKSVEFRLQRPDGSFYKKTENTEPFSLFGDDLRIFNTWPKSFGDGNYILTVTPYSDIDGPFGGGQSGESINLRLQLIN